ncbi:MAG: outer membrane beta-barrel protein [Ectothiorhodospiraceae bacterium]|nr:outer membrane beta-barrel protein [Ectothiorhodospiraceae bacterium]
MERSRLVRWVVAGLCALMLCPLAAHAADAPRVTVTEPFLELHTGPGRGYPVHHVLERGDGAVILKRRTDWFKVRGESGVIGWVDRGQMEQTLSETGIPMSFGEVLVADYLARRFEMGAVAGVLERDSAVGLRVGYRLGEYLSAELGITHVPGTFSSSRLYSLNLVSSPFAGWRVAPTFTVGIGHFDNVPRPTMVADETFSGTSANAGFGFRAYLSRHFLLRADLRQHLVLMNDERNLEFREVTGGVAFFF